MAVAWASLGVLAAIAVTFFVYLGTKIDVLVGKIDAQGPSLAARIDAQGRDLSSRIDAQGDALSARIDRLSALLAEHIAGHRHAG